MWKYLVLFIVLSISVHAQNYPQFNATVYDSSGTGYYFLVPIKMGPQGANFNPYHMILDSVGNVVYYKEFVSGLNTGDFKLLSNGLMTYTYLNKYYLIMIYMYNVNTSFSLSFDFEESNHYDRSNSIYLITNNGDAIFSSTIIR